MFDSLIAAGFQIAFHSHAEAILSVDFPEAAKQLDDILVRSTIPVEEIVGSGGGETKGTQRLRRALHEHKWTKHKFEVRRTIDGVEREAISHEVDHVARFANGTVALEIEWNNKDPFFDRDLENYKRLHADGAISLGILVTRGVSMQDEMRAMILRLQPKTRSQASKTWNGSASVRRVDSERNIESGSAAKRPFHKLGQPLLSRTNSAPPRLTGESWTTGFGAASEIRAHWS